MFNVYRNVIVFSLENGFLKDDQSLEYGDPRMLKLGDKMYRVFTEEPFVFETLEKIVSTQLREDYFLYSREYGKTLYHLIGIILKGFKVIPVGLYTPSIIGIRYVFFIFQSLSCMCNVTTFTLFTF